MTGLKTLLVMSLAAGAACVGTAASAPPSDQLSEDAKRLLGAAPKDAIAVGIIDSPKPFWSYATAGMWFPMREENRAAMESELRRLMSDRVGLDFEKVHTVMMFGTPEPSAGGLAVGVSGALKGGDRELESGTFIMHKGDLLAIGDRATATAALSAGAANKPPVSELAKLLAAEMKGAYAAIAVDLVAIAKLEELPIAGLGRVSLIFGSTGLRARLTGEQAGLAKVKALYDDNATEAVTEIRTQKVRAIAAGEVYAPALIVGHYWLKTLTSQLAPKLDGDALVVEIPFAADNPMYSLAMVGMVSAAALPAFFTYQKKANTAEAQDEIRKIYEGARQYYQE